MVFEKLKELLIEEWDMDESEITPESRLGYDLYFDEIDFADLVMDIEDIFSVEVDFESSFENITLEALTKYIEENI